MTLPFETFLTAICAQIKELNSNEFQKIYAVTGPVESQLAHDILVAHGFDAKIYHEAGKASKLYITNPTTGTPEQLAQTFNAALAYARSLKSMKLSLDELTANPALQAQYSVTIANMQPSGKQIVIQVAPAVAQPQIQQAPAAPAQPQYAAASAVRTAAVATPKARGPKPKSHYEELSAGPAVGKVMHAGRIAADGSTKEETWSKRMFLYLTGNMATSSFAALTMLVIIAVLFTFFIMGKSFLCPDFGSMKRNHSWYCQMMVGGNDEQQQ